MFKRDVKSIGSLVLQALRQQGLETPLKQRRLIEAWPTVAGAVAAEYTQNIYIYNQTLYVRLTSPALRADLSMQRTELCKRLNDTVGEQIITNIHFG